MPNLAELVRHVAETDFPKICVAQLKIINTKWDLLLKHSPSSRVSEPLHFPLWQRQEL